VRSADWNTVRTEPSALGLIVGFVVGMVLYMRLPWLLDLVGLIGMAVGGGVLFGYRRQGFDPRSGQGWLTRWRSRSRITRQVDARGQAAPVEQPSSLDDAQ
jgi:hypothetical protein